MTNVASIPADAHKAAFLASSAKPEIQLFLEKVIRHPLLRETMKAIKSTHAMSGVVGTGMLVLGEPGVGKTTILKSYVKKYMESRDDLQTDELTRKPILYVPIPSKPTIKGLIAAILEQGDHIEPFKGTQAQMEHRLSQFIQQQCVELIIFDEFQHMLREQAQISTRNVLNFIKLLMDKHKLAIVMAGVEDAYDSIAKYDELYQRFTYEQITIRPFDIDDDNAIASFRSYLRACENILKEIGISTVELSSDLMLRQVYLATGGKLRLVSRLITKTMEISDLSKKLTKNDYRDAYSRSRLMPRLKDFNPFAAQKAQVMERLRTCK